MTLQLWVPPPEVIPLSTSQAELRKLVHRSLLRFLGVWASVLGIMAPLVSYDLSRRTPWVLHPTVTRVLGWLVALYGLFWIAWWFFWTAIEGGEEIITLYGLTWAPVGDGLVRTGPFEWVRYPLAFGYLEFLWGLGWLVQSSTAVLKIVPALAVLTLLYLRFVLDRRREQTLGDRYRHYRRSTPLFIPRIPSSAAILHVFKRRKRR